MNRVLNKLNLELKDDLTENDEKKNSKLIKKINHQIIRQLGGGKSGGIIFLLKNNKILKIYPDFSNEKSIKRNLTDIYLYNKLSNSYTPKVYDYGILYNIEVNEKLIESNENNAQLYLIMKLVEGDELLNYKPQNNIIDKLILLELAKVLRKLYLDIKKKNKPIGCHKDLHPRNIFYKIIKKDNKIKVKINLIDFDLSITDNNYLTPDTTCTRKNMDFIKKTLLKENIAITYQYINPTLFKKFKSILLSNKLPKENIFFQDTESDADLFAYFRIYSYYSQENFELFNIYKIIRNDYVLISEEVDDKKLLILDLFIKYLKKYSKRN